MSRLYERCPLCAGSLKMPDGVRVNGQSLQKLLPRGECPCTLSKTPGWSEVGLTTGQVRRMVAERDALLTLARRARKVSAILAEFDGDYGVVDQEHWDQLWDAADKLPEGV